MYCIRMDRGRALRALRDRHGPEALWRLVDARGSNLLHLCVFFNSYECAAVVLAPRRGAAAAAADGGAPGPRRRARQPGDDGRTPLHAAASHGASSPRGALGIKLPRTRAGGHEATVQLLLDRGAAVNQVNDRGDTPLAIAELWGNEASATRIRAAGGRVVTPSWWQCC